MDSAPTDTPHNDLRILDPREIEAADARASSLMKEGIRLMQAEKDPDAALLYFDRALELRQRLPTDTPRYAYGLAACWLNRAEALTSCVPTQPALALRAYDEALLLLRSLPLGEDERFSRRLAIAWQNRALVLAAQNPPAREAAIDSLLNAIAVLGSSEATGNSERDFLLAVVWMNLANIQVSMATAAADATAADAARRTLALVTAHEHENPVIAEAGIKARHVLCQIAARRLSSQARGDTAMADVHDATDLADDGLNLVREWEGRGIDGFRMLAADLFRFGARVYAYYQPQFLQEFITEQLNDSQQVLQPYVQSREMQDAAREIASLFPPFSSVQE